MKTEASTPRTGDTPVLEIRGFSLRIASERGDVRAAEDVSLQASAGQVVAVVGESGAGKSVLAMSILRLVPSPPSRVMAGQILLGGRDVLQLDRREVREIRGREASMIFQEPMTALNPALRVGKQIAEPLVRHKDMSWRDAEIEAVDLLRQVQIPDPEERVRAFPHQFSGGMRQRVMIAMALACRPRLIIADEPTTALDVTVQAQILSLLTSLVRDAGGALLLITHDLGVVARYADQVNVMYAGRIVESGPAAQVYESPRHPYTRALLASVPSLAGPVLSRLDAIPGQPPSLVGEASGCAFAPRCPKAQAHCLGERPTLAPDSATHRAACWFS
jgi:oligopeptide/dipeptide ABC transporter ATP-binding protein